MYSIIVPIYKVEDYLTKCIESILAQTYKNFELILVDDGSPDNCPKICDEYAQKDNRVKVVHKENGGLVSARKAGLEIALGDYICFVDGDDFISSDMLENYENVLSNNNADMICTGYSKYYSEDKIVSVPQNITDGFYDKNDLKSQLYPKMLSDKPFYSFFVQPTIWSKCIKKCIAVSIYKNINNNISLGEDVAATYPALIAAESVIAIDYRGYMYRQNPDSMTHTYDKNLYEKVRNLIVHLKTVEKTMGWQAGNQINEYAVYLLILAKNNEFKYNKSSTYRTKKSNMKCYLSDPIFKEALTHIELSGAKNKFIVSCFKKNLLMPIYIYESILNERG